MESTNCKLQKKAWRLRVGDYLNGRVLTPFIIYSSLICVCECCTGILHEYLYLNISIRQIGVQDSVKAAPFSCCFLNCVACQFYFLRTFIIYGLCQRFVMNSVDVYSCNATMLIAWTPDRTAAARRTLIGISTKKETNPYETLEKKMHQPVPKPSGILPCHPQRDRALHSNRGWEIYPQG